MYELPSGSLYDIPIFELPEYFGTPGIVAPFIISTQSGSDEKLKKYPFESALIVYPCC